MKPKKLSRFLSAVLALALVAGLMPAAFAAERAKPCALRGDTGASAFIGKALGL